MLAPSQAQLNSRAKHSSWKEDLAGKGAGGLMWLKALGLCTQILKTSITNDHTSLV